MNPPIPTCAVVTIFTPELAEADSWSLGFGEECIVGSLFANRKDLICAERSFMSASWTLRGQAHWGLAVIRYGDSLEVYTTFAFP